MTLSAAYASSLGGLSAIAKWADATASNIANVDRPGYARRTVSASTGLGGVLTATIGSERDPAVERLHRVEVARSGRQQATADLLAFHTAKLGQPSDPGGLTTGVAALSTALAELSHAPERTVAQSAVVGAAQGLVATIRDIAAGIDDLAALAGTRIDQSVAEINQDLLRLGEINVHLGNASLDPAQRTAFEDELAQVADRLASRADVRLTREADLTYTAFTPGGTILVADGTAARLVFDHDLDRLTVATATGPVDVTPTRSGARGFQEGRLAGEVAVLLDHVPGMRSDLDAFAATLAETFEAADPTVGAGGTGLFVDPGPATGSATLAGRIEVNAIVRPDGAGEVWRIRDGIGAASPGPPGDSSLVLSFVEALRDRQDFAVAGTLPETATLEDFAAALVTRHHGLRVSASSRHEAIAAGAAALSAAREASTGVDLDSELQALTRLQQGYRANSEVMRTLTAMIDTLLSAV